MVDVVDFHEGTPTYPGRLCEHPDSWYEVDSEDGEWVYVVRDNLRGEARTLYRFPKEINEE